MDFFESQDIARRNTSRLVVLFSLAVVVLTIGSYFAFLIGYYAFVRDEIITDPYKSFSLWNGGVFVFSTFATLATIFLGSYFKTRSLSSGGSAVAESLGGRRVAPSTTSEAERRLVNVVEEMALASGVPVPAIFVLDYEQGINAFAAGYTMNDAAVAVTRGCLDYLTRDELQGVVAHEFAHILNGDMRLNIRLIGVLHGILIIFLTGRILFRAMRGGRGGGRNSGGGVLVIFLMGLILVTVGWFGLFFGRLIKSAVSRQREYLADAAAVQFTRNPAGLAGALKKVGGAKHGSTIQASNAEELSHLFFGSYRGGRWRGSWTQNFMSTHPPLDERLRRLDPSFDGKYVKAEPVEGRMLESQSRGGMASGAGPGAGSGAGSGAVMAMAMASAHVAPRPQQVIDSIGHASAEHIASSRAVLEGLPEEIRGAMHDPMGAVALMYTFLLDPDREQRQGQAALLKSHVEPMVLQEAMRLWPHVARLEASLKLPLVGLSVPALRTLAPEQYRSFLANLQRLIWADQKVVLFEFILHKVLRHHLDPNFNGADARIVKFRSLRPLLGDCHVLLSVLATMGHQDRQEAQKAYRGGLARLGEMSIQDYPLLAEGQFTFDALSNALDNLAVATPGVKRHVVEACAYCVLGDGQVTAEEADLLRGVCEILDCPLPPFLSGSGKGAAAHGGGAPQPTAVGTGPTF